MATNLKTDRPFPIEVKLRDGKTARLRLMEASDRDAILKFADRLPADDLLFLRTDITDKAVVAQWIDHIKSGNTVTILAEIDGNLAAYASVHIDQARWTRRVGEIRIISSSAYRGMGLGRR
ncbi:MAG TPA: GNAT family N-acetyltransferase, partial [Candidatus Binataceae bacterium]|nr:GNAT family N-acetyltransferase [Candidatus Binataceae bacterium]